MGNRRTISPSLRSDVQLLAAECLGTRVPPESGFPRTNLSGISLRRSVALPGLLSGRERHRDGISACALQATEHAAEDQGNAHCTRTATMYSSDPPRSHETRVSLFVITLASGCGPEGRGFEPRRLPKLEVLPRRQGRPQSERPGRCAGALPTAIVLQSASVRPSPPA